SNQEARNPGEEFLADFMDSWFPDFSYLKFGIGRWALSVQRFLNAQQSRARRRREKAFRIEPGQGALPESRVHQRSGDRLLHPDRAGALAAPRRSAADDETLSERRERGIFLRKELSIASAEMGEDSESLERGQQPDNE